MKVQHLEAPTASSAPGQGVAGSALQPLPSQVGRRRSILAGLSALAIAAVGCSTSPSAHDAEATADTVSTAPPSPLGLPAQKVKTVVGILAVYDSGPPPHGNDTARVLVLWPSILADHRMYRAQVTAWKPRHRVILIDGPGHGASGPAPGPFRLTDCAMAQAQVLDSLGVGQPVVSIGTSWGGLVAGEFALSYPQRTAAIALLNTPVFAPEGGFGEHFVAWGARWIHGMDLYIDGVARSFFLPETRARGGQVLDDFRAQLRHANGAALATAVRSVLIEREPLAPRMAQIQAPALMVAGDKDTMYPATRLQDAASQLPNGRFVTLPSSHISAVDAPRTTQTIDDFLNRL